MIAFTSAFPRNSSRTRTQAVTAPSTAFTSVTTTAAPSVSFSAATASGLETASQKDSVPALVAAQTSAAIGRPTRTVRNVVTKPRERAVAALSLEAPARCGDATTTEVMAASARDAPDLPLDPSHDPLLRVEESCLDPVP